MFTCADPARLCEFWAAALDYEVQEAPPRFMEAWLEQGGDPNAAAAATDPAGAGPRLFFAKGEKSRPTMLPIHLDLTVEDRDAEVERLVHLGATVVETKSRAIGEYVEQWTVMHDPESNGFCVK